MATTYARSNRTAKESKGQAKLVLDALTEAPQTLEEITAKIVVAGLVTVQTPSRIAAYYLAIFKKSGVVRVHETQPADEPEPIVVAAVESEDEDNDDNDDSDDDEDDDSDDDEDENEESEDVQPAAVSGRRK